MTAKHVRITLINDVNFLLYSARLPARRPARAAGTPEPRHIVVPLRERLRRTELRMGSATGADPSANRLCTELVDGAEASCSPNSRSSPAGS